MAWRKARTGTDTIDSGAEAQSVALDITMGEDETRSGVAVAAGIMIGVTTTEGVAGAGAVAMVPKRKAGGGTGAEIGMMTRITGHDSYDLFGAHCARNECATKQIRRN